MDSPTLVYIGPFMAPLVYVICFITMILAIILVFYPRYNDSLIERIGASLAAFGAVSVWYNMIDGFFIPRSFWAWGWGIALVLVGMLNKLPRKNRKKERL